MLKASNTGWGFRNEFLMMEKSEQLLEGKLRAIWILKDGTRFIWRHSSKKALDLRVSAILYH